MKNTKERAIIVGGVLLLAVLTVLVVTSVRADNRRAQRTYDHALELVAQGQFSEALVEFKRVEQRGYPNTEAYIDYCQAHIDWDELKFDAAIKAFAQARAKSDSVALSTEFFHDLYNCRKAAVQYEEDQRQKQLQEEREARERYQARLKNEPPFKGMSENDIDKTLLGKHTDYVSNTFVKSGEIYYRHIYWFQADGKTVYKAVCVDGKVTEVEDYRADPIPTPYITTTPQASSGEKNTDDPYHASDYVYADDFYDDYYADFWDYEDAEDYWEAHRG